jgi:hypothetical protein
MFLTGRIEKAKHASRGDLLDWRRLTTSIVDPLIQMKRTRGASDLGARWGKVHSMCNSLFVIKMV